MMNNETAPLTTSQPNSHDMVEVDREDLARFQATPTGNKRAVIISVFFLMVALFIGVPVWLKTTATYQAPLPFWDIKALCSRSIRVTLPVILVSFSDKLTDADLSAIGLDLAKSEDAARRCGTPIEGKEWKKLSVGCTVETRSMPSGDREAVQNALTKSSSLADFLSKMEALLPLGVLDKTKSHSCKTSDCTTHTSSTYTISILPDSVHALLKRVNSSTASSFDPTLPVSIVQESATRNLIHIVLPQSRGNVANGTLVNRDQITLHVAKLINSVLLSVDDLQHLVRSPSNESQPKPVVESQIETSFAQAIIKQLPPSTSYDITVTVLTNADEARGNSSQTSQVTWNEQMLSDPTAWLTDQVQSIFQPWLPHVHVQFFSQRLHAVDVENLVPSYMSSNGTYRYYTADDLSTLVNYLESYLGAPQAASAATRDLAGTKPGLHLILFMAMPAESGTGARSCPQPLRFHLSSEWSPFTVTNVAVVPQWGGLFAVDAPSPCQSSSTPQVRSALLARQLISVIRSLLGLPEKRSKMPNLIELQSNGELLHGQVFHAQLDSWFLRRTVESLLSIKVTMTSLVDLLSRFPNMVINDHVAHEVTRSTQVWAQTLDALKHIHAGNHTATDLGAVFLSAQDALESVNSAFFDHSLLGRLYFQEDQKYGIYVPLFLPVGFGILSSTISAFRILFPRES